MGLFKSKKNDVQEETPRTPRNPSTFFVIRLLAVGYLLWMVKDLVQMYIAGGEDAPSLGLLILSIVLFVGGSVWIAITSWKQYQQMQAEQAAEAEAAALLEAEEVQEEDPAPLDDEEEEEE